MKDKKISSRFIDTISGSLTPILNLLIATGIIKCFLHFATATGLMDATAGTYQILFHCRDCFSTLCPSFRIYGNSVKNSVDSVCWMAIGAALVPVYCGHYGGEPLYTLFAGFILSHWYMLHFGIPVILMNYASSVIPVVLVCFLRQSWNDFDRCIPHWWRHLSYQCLQFG